MFIGTLSLNINTHDLNYGAMLHSWAFQQFLIKKYAVRTEVIDYITRCKNLEKQATLYKNAEDTKKLRDGFYYKMPKFIRARLYYWYRYYLKLGFLDGKPGKIYAFIQAYMYRYIVDAKIYELEVKEKTKRK